MCKTSLAHVQSQKAICCLLVDILDSRRTFHRPIVTHNYNTLKTQINTASNTKTTVQPYCFEPQRPNSVAVDIDSVREQASDSGADSEAEGDAWDGVDVETEGWRLHQMLWCTCENCTRLPTIPENICCREMESLGTKLEGVKCVTKHADFGTICLNPAVLRTALVARDDIRRDGLREPIKNE